jgi:predicted transport protein
MPIFKINQRKAGQLGLKRDGFGNEFELRDFFAENLEHILGVRFLAKEYQTTDGRIDTLGLDENDSPVIIEYKWKENEEVLAQGLFYLNWLLKNKKHFELLVKDRLGEKAHVSWDQPRVILIAQGFDRYIKAAVQTMSNVELKTYTLYEGDILHVENQYSPIPEKTISKKTLPTEAGKEEYNLSYHTGITSPEMQQKFNEIRDLILKLPSVEEKLGQKTGITYRITKSFTRFEFRKTWIQVLLRDSKYPSDEMKIVKDISTNEWGYTGMVRFEVDTDINYLFNLIKDSYNSTL